MGQTHRRASRPKPNKRYHSGSAGGTKGSPEPEFLVVGRIIKPHGIRGDLAMKVITDYPERLPEIETLYVGPAFEPYQVKRVRFHAGGTLMLFKGVEDRNAAELLRGMLVYVHIDDAVPLEEGEYYLFQIIGAQVVTGDGRVIGTLTDFLETGANDVYVITSPDNKEILIPVIPEVIKQVDVDKKVVTINLLDGLLQNPDNAGENQQIV
jgi:16S rRNA processing protein RimM